MYLARKMCIICNLSFNFILSRESAFQTLLAAMMALETQTLVSALAHRLLETVTHA